MAKKAIPPPSPPSSAHGRTQWDVLLELSRRRSFLVWACVIGWGILAAASAAWYYDILPSRGTKASPNQASQHLHWSFQPTSASREACSAAAMRVQSSAGANATETWDQEPSETVVVGVHGSSVTAVGCAGFPVSPQSLVLVAAPEQTQAQNKEVLLRKLLQAELQR
jgi:hypothetical protein